MTFFFQNKGLNTTSVITGFVFFSVVFTVVFRSNLAVLRKRKGRTVKRCRIKFQSLILSLTYMQTPTQTPPYTHIPNCIVVRVVRVSFSLSISSKLNLEQVCDAKLWGLFYNISLSSLCALIEISFVIL